MLAGTGTAAADDWVKVAVQWGDFTLTEPAHIRYGDGTSWLEMDLDTGLHNCNNKIDPAPGKAKFCQRRTNATLPPLPPASITYYVASCDAGAQAGCVAGDDKANDGLSPARPKKTLFAVPFDSLPAGAQVLLARGGAWTASADVALRGNPQTGAPIVLGAYTASWSGSAKPRYTFVGGIRHTPDGDEKIDVAFRFSGPGGNAVVRELAFYGGDSSLTTFLTWGTVSNVSWLGNEFHGGATALQVGVANPLLADFPMSHHLLFSGNTVSDSHSNALLFGADDSVIENNKFYNNARSGQSGDHHLYLSCRVTLPTEPASATGCKNVTVRNNLFEDNAHPGAGVMVIQHDLWSNLLIENNVVRNTNATVNPLTWGISLTAANKTLNVEGCKTCMVRGNTVVNVADIGIDVAAVRDTVVTKNTIVWTRQLTGRCVRVGWWKKDPANPDDRNDLLDDHVEVSHNACYLGNTVGDANAIYFAGPGARHVITDNLIYFGNDAPSANCFYSDVANANFAKRDHNACFSAGGNRVKWSNLDAQLANWRAVTGFDKTSVNADPQLAAIPTVAKPAITLKAGSPATGIGATPTN